jgi:hypothetical protein
LSDKDSKQVDRENDIITRLETQSQRFSSNTIFHFFLPLFLVLRLSFGVDEILLFLSREKG